MDQAENPRKQGLFITIDANIGAGKTNACHAIGSAATAGGWPARVLEEPTHSPKFTYFLNHYYDDLRTGNNTGGGFSMQMFMLCQRYEQHRLAVELAWGPQGQVVIQDRPIYGDTVFATTAMERGFMTRQEFELYVDVFRNMSRDVMPPDIFVYLDVAPEECHRRMDSPGPRGRGRRAAGLPAAPRQELQAAAPGDAAARRAGDGRSTGRNSARPWTSGSRSCGWRCRPIPGTSSWLSRSPSTRGCR